jgi:hypothetical protein
VCLPFGRLSLRTSSRRFEATQFDWNVIAGDKHVGKQSGDSRVELEPDRARRTGTIAPVVGENNEVKGRIGGDSPLLCTEQRKALIQQSPDNRNRIDRLESIALQMHERPCKAVKKQRDEEKAKADDEMAVKKTKHKFPMKNEFTFQIWSERRVTGERWAFGRTAIKWSKCNLKNDHLQGEKRSGTNGSEVQCFGPVKKR